MAATFQITDNSSNSLSLTTQGKVVDSGGNVTGTWTTNANNDIVVQGNPDQNGNAPAPDLIPACWIFNDKNQFCVEDSSGTELLNFNTAIADNFPSYELRNTQLRVRPEDSFAFEFFITGDWSMDDKHQLTFTANGKSSTIVGILADNKSRFTYRFRDLDQPAISNRLTFTGKWEQKTVDGQPNLSFHYKATDGTEKTFEMPGKLIVQRGTNQFRYTYDKDNRTFGITLLGFLKVSENFEITYTIDKQESGEGDELVAKTTFVLQASFHGNQFDGDLTLALVKDDASPGDFLLTLTGEYTAVTGDTSVMVGFKFSQVRRGRKVTTKFGFGGSFTWKNGHIAYQFSAGDGTVDLMLDLNIKLRDGGSVDSRLEIHGADGEVKSITFLFGVTF